MSMTHQTFALTSILLLLLTLSTRTSQAEPSLLVVGIEDGDTLVVEIDGKTERLQLAGIDAPEAVENAKLRHDINRSGLPQARLLQLGQLATEHLATLVTKGGFLQLIDPLGIKDRYGRIEALVISKGPLSLSAQMVKDGFAIALRHHAPNSPLKSQLIKLEQQAIEQQKGLWGSARSEAFAWRDQNI